MSNNVVFFCHHIVSIFCELNANIEINFIVSLLGTTKVKPFQFKTKAAAVSFIKQHIDPSCDATKRSLKSLQDEIKCYLEIKKTSHETQGSLGIVALDKRIQFSSFCLGNGDMIIAASNSTKTLYTISTDFDGVGILGSVSIMSSYAEGWINVSSLALSGNQVAVSADGVVHVVNPSQGTMNILRDTEGQAISSQAVNVAWIGNDILFCEHHSVKLFKSGAVAVIAGSSQGDCDGSQMHSKLCQPVGICVEFNRNIFIADSGSGSIKLINRPLRGIAEFLGKLQILVKAFNIHSRRSKDQESEKSVDQAIQMVSEVKEYVKVCSKKARDLQSLKKTTTDGPEGTLSNKCLKSLELMVHSLQKLSHNIQELSSYPGFKMSLNLESLLTLNVENQHAVTHFKKETFTLYEYAQIFGSSIEEAVKRVTPWTAHYYTHPKSYYPVATSGYGKVIHAEIPRPIGETISRNDEAEMRFWAKRHGKCVRQRNVRQDNTKDRAGTLPLNLYETETVLEPLDLQTVMPDLNAGPRSEPCLTEETDETSQDEQLVDDVAAEQEDVFSDSEDSELSDENDDAAEPMATPDDSDRSFNITRTTRAGRERVFTSRMAYFLQHR